MEVFRIEKSEDFDLDIWVDKLEVKPGDLLLLKSNNYMPKDIIIDISNQFVSLVENAPGYEGVRLFIFNEPGMDISKLTDEQLEAMGLMRIPEKKGKGKNGNKS